MARYQISLSGLVFLFLSMAIIMGLSTQGGKIVDNPVKYPGTSEKNYFVSPTGKGDCSAWESACTFRKALEKVTGVETATMYISGGIHNLDNGSDPTGTDITLANVRIFGMNNELGNPITRLVNGAANATYILRVSGQYVSINNIAFGNYDQPDKNVIMLNIRGSYNDVQRCTFHNTAADPGGTGILVDNNAFRTTIVDDQFFSVKDSGVEVGLATDVVMARNNFYGGGKGLFLSNAGTTRVSVQDTEFLGMTTGFHYAAAAANNTYMLRAYFANCVDNVSPVAVFGSTWFETIEESNIHRGTYPADGGALISKNAAAWTWGPVIEIIPNTAFSKPIQLRHINIQSWNAAQIYKIELFYGSVSPAVNSLGVSEITVGNASGKEPPVDLPVSLYLPAHSAVGARIQTSTAASDDITFTLGYEEL